MISSVHYKSSYLKSSMTGNRQQFSLIVVILFLDMNAVRVHVCVYQSVHSVWYIYTKPCRCVRRETSISSIWNSLIQKAQFTVCEYEDQQFRVNKIMLSHVLWQIYKRMTKYNEYDMEHSINRVYRRARIVLCTYSMLICICDCWQITNIKLNLIEWEWKRGRSSRSSSGNNNFKFI